MMQLSGVLYALEGLSPAVWWGVVHCLGVAAFLWKGKPK